MLPFSCDNSGVGASATRFRWGHRQWVALTEKQVTSFCCNVQNSKYGWIQSTELNWRHRGRHSKPGVGLDWDGKKEIFFYIFFLKRSVSFGTGSEWPATSSRRNTPRSAPRIGSADRNVCPPAQLTGRRLRPARPFYKTVPRTLVYSGPVPGPQGSDSWPVGNDRHECRSVRLEVPLSTERAESAAWPQLRVKSRKGRFMTEAYRQPELSVASLAIVSQNRELRRQKFVRCQSHKFAPVKVH